MTSYMREMACQMGLPNVIKSDGGPCYKSLVFKDFADKYGIRHVLTSAYHHESNGQAERGVREVKKLLARNVGKEKLEELLLYLNTTDRRNGTGSAMQLLFNRECRGPLPNSYQTRVDLEEKLEKRRALLEKLAVKRGRQNRDQFEKGDKVRVQNMVTKKWTTIGKVTQCRIAPDGTVTTYNVLTDDGTNILWNGRFLQHHE